MVAEDHRLVVVADDDDSLRLLCRVNLELEDYLVAEAGSAAELTQVLESEDVALVLLDIRFGSDDGIEIARSLRRERPDIRIVFLSGSAPFGEPTEAVSDAAITKPFTLEELIQTVRRLAPR